MPIHGYPGGVITANPVAPTSTVATGVWTTEQQLQATSAGNWPRPGPAQPISRSLRFNSADSTYLNRTPASAGNRKTWTWSAWVKRSTLGTVQGIFDAYVGGNDFASAFFNSDNTIYFYACSNPGTFVDYDFTTTAVFRDASAWYHIVLVLDTSNATQADRFIVYVNGVRQTGTNPSGAFDLNVETYINSTASHRLGQRVDSSYYFNGYMTEVYFIGGSALTPSSFGQTNTATGVWEPISYTGSYSGTNSFYLNFSDNSGATSTTLGKDYSGNGNNWTPNNFSVTAGVGNDSLVDSPTSYGTDTGVGGEVRGNYCTLNPLDKNSNLTLSNGNLDFVPANTSDLYSGRSTFQIPSTGKWIWQVTNTNSAYMITAGLIDGATPLLAQQTVSCASMTVGSIGTFFSTTQWMNTTTSWSVTNVGNGDTLVIAYDADAGKIWFGRVASGGSTVSWYNTSGTADPSTGTDPRASGITAGKWFAGVGAYYTPSGASINYGQRPFAFTNAPSGFKALCTQNLPTPTIGATSTTQANDYFNVVLWTGDNTTPRNITGVGFQPDFVWIKARSAAYWHRLFDAVRGATKTLYSNVTDAEATTTDLTAFLTDGFTTNNTDVNGSGITYVAWNWNAGGSNATNTAGTITSTVRANTTSGFSIVTYTGNGTSGATVGHGLGVTPGMIIIKARTAAYNWAVWHTSLGGGNNSLQLNNTGGTYTAFNYWNSTSPSSTVFTLGNDAGVNQNTNFQVAYCFAPVAGYSAFGSYTGNGSTDGPFVYTGFRPRYLLVKDATAAAENWQIVDTARNTYNVAPNILQPNRSDAESAFGSGGFDILSNGFKIRTSSSSINTNGSTIIYAAFAESPFKYSLAR